MAQAPLENVVAHWHQLIENLQASPISFYGSVEAALQRREIPGLRTSRVDWGEGGALSPRREYLRVTGQRHEFDICAAPFGTGFFFSSWLTNRKARFVLLYLLAFLIIALAIWWALHWVTLRLLGGNSGSSMLSPWGLLVRELILVPLSLFILFWLIGMASRAGWFGPECAMLTVPVLAWVYATVFAPETYYRLDTMLMFQSAVHAALLETIDGVTSAKGLRALTEAERKPIFHKMA